MPGFFKVFKCMLLDVPPAGHVGALQAGPDGLRGLAVHAVPLLGVQDGVVLGES